MAMSEGPSGVARMASKVFAYFSLKKRLNVDFEEGAVHGRGGHQAGCDVRGIGDVADVADERAQAEADAEQIEDRLEEAGDDDGPVAPIDDDVALEHLVGP